MPKYYRAGPEVAAICERIIEAEHEAIDKGCKLSRKYGGSRTVVLTRRNPWGDLKVVGFKFTKEPDQKIFKKMKYVDGWEPRLSTKKGKELSEQLNELTVLGFADLTNAIGMEVFKGLRIRRPGIEKIGDHYYLKVPEDVEPKGCERVSDVEFEGLAA